MFSYLTPSQPGWTSDPQTFFIHFLTHLHYSCGEKALTYFALAACTCIYIHRAITPGQVASMETVEVIRKVGGYGYKMVVYMYIYTCPVSQILQGRYASLRHDRRFAPTPARHQAKQVTRREASAGALPTTPSSCPTPKVPPGPRPLSTGEKS